MAPEVASEERHLTSSTHAVPVRIHRPDRASGWLVWAHGGSWRSGSSREWHDACSHLASVARCTVISVDYRLTPHRHPAALHDVLIALDWAQAQATKEGQPPRLAVGGDSAGGTLAACAALVRRDRGWPLTAQVLAYPPLDPTCSADSYRETHGFPTRDGMIAAWQAYRGEGAPISWEGIRLPSTPLEAATLAGTPPTVLAVGDLDPVADDVQHYVGLLRDAGTAVQFRLFSGMAHGAFRTGVLGQDGQGDQSHALRRYLGVALRRHFDEPPAAFATPSQECS
ncbi:alpha/beta hydrolase [Streptomyces sp. NPDC013457]|uniref:alpha/beta hydrolase n=1 Tax=Streptomyces sp. NPDC013457 TaxID=3364866 RepID=UPI003700F4FE